MNETLASVSGETITCVFVQADSKVTQKDMEARLVKHGVYYEPIRRPMSLLFQSSPPEPSMLDVREFRHFGEMFDGRLIFCDAARWAEVRTAEVAIDATRRNSEELIANEAQTRVRQFIDEADGLRLDARQVVEDMEHQMFRVRRSEKVAIPKK